MTNAEKFKEVFGFNLNIEAFLDGEFCLFMSTKCREMPCNDCIRSYWQSQYIQLRKTTGGSDEEFTPENIKAGGEGDGCE